jgi:hypothetical protein
MWCRARSGLSQAATPAAVATPAMLPGAPRAKRTAATTSASTQSTLAPEAMQGVLHNLARESRASLLARRHFAPCCWRATHRPWTRGVAVQVTQSTSLVDVLAPESVEPLLEDPGRSEMVRSPSPCHARVPHSPSIPCARLPAVVQRLVQHLPEGSSPTAEELRANLRSPQFAQVLCPPSPCPPCPPGGMSGGWGEVPLTPRAQRRAGLGGVQRRGAVWRLVLGGLGHWRRRCRQRGSFRGGRALRCHPAGGEPCCHR